MSIEFWARWGIFFWRFPVCTTFGSLGSNLLLGRFVIFSSGPIFTSGLTMPRFVCRNFSLGGLVGIFVLGGVEVRVCAYFTGDSIVWGLFAWRCRG